MLGNEISPVLDFAQLALIVFFLFFAGLIYWIRREDRREGYPLESDPRGVVRPKVNVLLPSPKTFHLPEGGTYHAPDFQRDEREVAAKKAQDGMHGQPFLPTGDAITENVGPASYAQRHDSPELTREGHLAVVPMRVASDYRVSAGPDPRGWDVLGADRKVGATVKDIWVDRADMLVRYLELELSGEGGTRLVPVTLANCKSDKQVVEVSAVRSDLFAKAPTLKEADQITLMEEEMIGAFFAGGTLYGDDGRTEAFV